MYRQVEDFLTDWENASAGTIKVLEAMTDDKLEQKIAAEHNSLGWLGWHLANAPAYFFSLINKQIKVPGDMKTVPTNAKEIVDGYNNVSKQIIDQVKTFTDENLVETVDQHGQQTPIGAILRAMIDHQTHHRGQMTVLLRQAELVVPGVMGPTKEGN